MNSPVMVRVQASPGSADVLAKPLQYIRGVGPARADQLARLGLHTVEDLLWHVPRRHDDRSRVVPIHDATHGGVETVAGAVVRVDEARPRRGLVVTKAAITDATGIAHVVWFNQPYVRRQLRAGARMIVTGKVERRFGEIQITSPEFELAEIDDDTLHTGRVVPVYSLTEGLSQGMMRVIVRHALDAALPGLDEVLPERVRARRGLLPLRDAIRLVHFPDDLDQARAARRRLAFDELLALQLGVLARRRVVEETVKPHTYADDGGLLDRFTAGLAFPLTAAQRRVIGEIVRDMADRRPMNRLLQGDVGSGKTVVAAAAVLRAVGGGLQAAVMAPTEILAGQHYLTLRPMLAALGVGVVLLVGGLRRADRVAALEAIASGEADVVIGTHALIEEGVRFRALGLVVVDEQHKFGVLQRAELRSKGLTPDVMVMTATPIPRTLALTLYGDLDVSLLDEMPPGRTPVATFWRAPERRDAVYGFVREQVRQGRQAFVVCPLVEESEKLQAKAATELAERLARDVFPDLRVGLIHGRQPVGERDRTMAAFRAGEIQVLVATTVIEVGIDVPNATAMVVEDAERFGLAQLHQLRGRIGRGGHRSYCILVGRAQSEEARRRLEVMVETADGFAIAREDMALRGPGELMGTRQHGLPDLRVASLLDDLELMERAREDAHALLAVDRRLTDPEHAGLRRMVRRQFRGGVELLSVS